MDFRQLHGENITGESWLIRDTWQKIDREHGHRIGLAQYPRKMNSAAIMNLLHRAWQVQGIREKISHPQQKRHEFKCTHSFRKMFESKCQKAKMNHNNIKLLMDHSLAESQNYYRPEEQDILNDYLNAVNELTINEENRLNAKIQSLEKEKTSYDFLNQKVESLQNSLVEILNMATKNKTPEEVNELFKSFQKKIEK